MYLKTVKSIPTFLTKQNYDFMNIVQTTDMKNSFILCIEAKSLDVEAKSLDVEAKSLDVEAKSLKVEAKSLEIV
jgi:hypothetical protein